MVHTVIGLAYVVIAWVAVAVKVVVTMTVATQVFEEIAAPPDVLVLVVVMLPIDADVSAVVVVNVVLTVIVAVDVCTTDEGWEMTTRPRATARTSTTKDRPIVALAIANLRRSGTMAVRAK